jgi:catecholate siderophore receptor
VGTAAFGAPAHAAARGGVLVSGQSLTRALAARQAAGGQAVPDAAVFTFAIPAGPLGAVLRQFEQTTGVSVQVPNAAIRSLQSPGVRGTMTAEQALGALLAGVGVRYRLSGPREATLDLAPLSEAIEVTASPLPAPSSPRYTAPLRDIPQTIQVIPREVIEAQGATTLRDVLRNVPGITMQAGEGGVPAGDNLSIRGFSARTDIFIDGVRDMGGYSRDSFNVEQVEVVKGPSSAGAGRGSTGGSVNLVTKVPMLDERRDVNVTGGSDAYKRAEVDLNEPIDPVSGTALRLSAMWQDAGVPGRDVARNELWGFAPSVSVGLGHPTQVTFGYMHLGQDNVPDYGVPWVPAANTALPAYADRPAPVDTSNFYGLRARDYERIDTDVVTLMVRHDAPGSSLRNLSRFGRTRRDSLITAPRFAGNNGTDIRRTDWKSRDQIDGIFSNQTDWTSRFSTGRADHALVTGVEISREQDINHTRVETGPAAPDTDLFRPNPDDPYVGALARNGAKAEGIATTAALYAFDTLRLDDRWELSGGLRWDAFNLDYLSVNAAAAETRFDRTDYMLSWRSGLVFEPAPGGSVYVGAGTSLNPSAEGLSLSTNTADLAPERTRNVEAGTKWDVAGGRASLTAAVFHTEKTNARTPGVNPGDPPQVLQGRQRVRGVELGLAGRLTRWWNVLAGFTGMSSRITASNTAEQEGNALAATPRRSFNLWSTFDLPWEVQVGGGVQFMDTVFSNANNTREAPSYWLVNATAAWRASQRLTLRANGRNLGNAAYVDRVGGGHFIPGSSRSATLSADVEF